MWINVTLSSLQVKTKMFFHPLSYGIKVRNVKKKKKCGQLIFEYSSAAAESICMWEHLYCAEFLRANTCEFHSHIVRCTVTILSCNIFMAGYNEISNSLIPSVVNIHSTCCSFIKLWNYETVYLCISYDSYNEQRLFP